MLGVGFQSFEAFLRFFRPGRRGKSNIHLRDRDLFAGYSCSSLRTPGHIHSDICSAKSERQTEC